MNALRSVRVSQGCALTGNPLRSYLPFTRSNDLPGRQNILSCIYVTVMFLTAVWALPVAATEREFLQSVTTIETPFAGWVESTSNTKLTSIPLTFVPKHLAESAQGSVRKHASKTVILGHATYIQIFNGDHVKASNKICGNFVKVVSSSVGYTSVESGYTEFLERSSLRPFFLTCEHSLCSSKLPRLFLKVSGVTYLFAVRERCQCGYAQVDSNCLMVRHQSLWFLIKAKGNKISMCCVLYYGDGSGRRLKLSRPVSVQSTDFSQRQGFGGCLPTEGRTGIFGGLLPALLFESGEPCTLFEEVYERCLKVPKSLLRRDGGNFIQPHVISSPFEDGQLGTRFSHPHSSTILVRICSKLKGPIVNIPRRPKGASDLLALLRGWVKSKTPPNFHKSSVLYGRVGVKRRESL